MILVLASKKEKRKENKEDLIKQCGTLLKTIKKLESELENKEFDLKDIEAENKLLKEEIKMLNRKIPHLQVQKNNLLESRKPAILVEGTKDGICTAIKQYFPSLGGNKLGKDICSVCWSFCDGIAKP